MTIKLAVIGLGWAGQFHASAIANHPQAELAAVVDTNEERAAAFAKKYGVSSYPTLEALLEAKPDIDGACVCTLPDTHIRLTETLVERGKHVLCEKPMGREPEPIRKLIALADEKGAIVGVNYNQRYAVSYQMLKRLIQGERLHLIQISMQQNGPVTKSDLVGDYFLISDSCCHLIDTLLFLNGAIDSVHVFGSRIGSEIVSDVVVGLLFANGTVGMMTHTFTGGIYETQHPFQRLDLTTDKARYTVENMYDGLNVFPHDELYRKTWVPSIFEHRDYASTMVASVTAWIDSVVNHERAPVGLMEAYLNAAVVQACIESLKTGVPVKVSH